MSTAQRDAEGRELRSSLCSGGESLDGGDYITFHQNIIEAEILKLL